MTKFKASQIEYQQFPHFSTFDQAFQARESKLAPFVGEWPTAETLQKKLQDKNFPTERRESLVEAIKSQYQKLDLLGAYKRQVELLADETTFTVITAHQPVLFGGPLYVPYKIASAIHLARQLNQIGGDQTVVPIFVIGGEDHDFDEMNHVHLYGKPIVWERESGGPVGRFDLSGLHDCINKVSDILGEPKSDIRVSEILTQAFSDVETYGEGYQKFIVSLFGQYGLLVLNMDDDLLKKQFAPVMSRELFENMSKPFVEDAQKEKEKAGFGAQTYVREINLFYVDQGHRSVILKEKDEYLIRDLDLRMTRGQLEEQLESSPEKFSPNVVMRPIYQEYTLPNLAYIGGGGELSYWAERQEQFKAFGLDFPILVRRSSAFHIDGFIEKRMNELELQLSDIVRDRHEVIKEKVSQDTTLDDTLKDMSMSVLREFSKLVNTLENQSNSLGQYAKSEERKLEKTLENFQTKSFREIKKEYDVKVGKIEKVFDHLFPENKLQERYANFLAYLNRHGREYLDFLIENLDPLETTVTMISEE